MSNEHQRDLFTMREADRKAVLDLFGQFIMKNRDYAIAQWDRILEGKQKYPPWERLLERHTDVDERTRQVVQEALPHIIDTMIHCLLAELDAKASTIRISTTSDNVTVDNLARASWGLATEPVGEDGWLARFSKERFEQPY